MTKNYRAIYFAILTCIFMSNCKNDTVLLIEPISKEYNERFITGAGLDSGLFSTKDVVQYYQISNFKSLSDKSLVDTISKFVNQRYLLNKTYSIKLMTIYFYRKRFFVDYSDHLYESARDNENRTLEGYSDDLLARVDLENFEPNDKRVIRQTSISITR